MSPAPRQPGRLPQRGRRRVLLGAFLLAMLRREGIKEFGDDRAAFLGSLLPLLAFPVGGFVFGLLGGAGIEALSGLLATLVALLTPPVISEALARHWGCKPAWLRYATAFNWTRWPLLISFPFGMGLGGALAGAGIPPNEALGLGMAAVAVYGAVLDWFVARVGLGLSGGRAAVLVVAVNVAAGVLFLGPRLLFGWTGAGVMP